LSLAIFATMVPGIDGQPADRRWARVLLAFALGGVAFLLRFQMALMLVGVGLWVLVVARIERPKVIGGVAAFASIVGLGVLIDRWGYGAWVLSALEYFRVNLIEGKAAEFGVRPTWAYVGLLWHDLGKPFGAIAIVALPIAAYRSRAHLLVWASVPFVLGHALIAHKESRFLFPYLFLLPVLFAIAIEGPWLARRSLKVAGGVLVAINLFMLCTFWGFRLAGGPFREAFYAHVGDRPAIVYYTGVEPFGIEHPRMTFMRPYAWSLGEKSEAEIEAILAAPHPALYWIFEERYARRPSMPRLELDCVELYHEPRFLPDTVMEHRLWRTLFELRSMRSFWECPAAE
jgi:hypothetical protein